MLGLRYLTGWLVVASFLVIALCPSAVSAGSVTRLRDQYRDLDTRLDASNVSLSDISIGESGSVLSDYSDRPVLGASVADRNKRFSENVYSRSKSPYLLTKEVIVERGQQLIIEPGVTLRFDPGVGITVRGVLKAQVHRYLHIFSHYDRIVSFLEPTKFYLLYNNNEVYISAIF